MSNYETTPHNRSEIPPHPYSQRPTGLYQIVPTKDGDAIEEWLCSDLLVLGSGSDAKGKSWGRLIELKAPDGFRHRLFLSMADISGSGSRVLGLLNDHGLQYASGKIGRDGILDLLRVWEGPDKYLVTRKMGWASPSCDSFVLDASTILGSRKVFYIGQSVHSSHGLSTRGSIDEWRAVVGKKMHRQSCPSICSVARFLRTIIRPAGNRRLWAASSRIFLLRKIDSIERRDLCLGRA